ncbi:MAG TPA: hypothetical protein VMU48_16415 [Terracidiphilus sp.]|nr:hypothetical protein [Terracidiphilus sp.]
MARIFVLLWFVPAVTAWAQTQTSCPWFTAGSAAKVLGGDVTIMAHSTGNWEGSCLFTRKTDSSLQDIEILIGKVKSDPCPVGSPRVIALGNEAMQCQRMTAAAQPEITIAGRIKDVYFVISMVNPSPAPGESPAGARHPDSGGASLIEQVAEQVVGNLY